MSSNIYAHYANLMVDTLCTLCKYEITKMEINKLEELMTTTTINEDIYAVMLDFGRGGLVIHEICFERNSKSNVLEDLSNHQYGNVASVFVFNPGEGTSRDVTEDLAIDCWETVKSSTERYHDVPDFIKTHHPDISDIQEYFEEATAAE